VLRRGPLADNLKIKQHPIK